MLNWRAIVRTPKLSEYNVLTALKSASILPRCEYPHTMKFSRFSSSPHLCAFLPNLHFVRTSLTDSHSQGSNGAADKNAERGLRRRGAGWYTPWQPDALAAVFILTVTAAVRPESRTAVYTDVFRKLILSTFLKSILSIFVYSLSKIVLSIKL